MRKLLAALGLLLFVVNITAQNYIPFEDENGLYGFTGKCGNRSQI